MTRCFSRVQNNCIYLGMTNVIGDFFFILACYCLSDASEREEKAPSKWLIGCNTDSYIILKLRSYSNKALILTYNNSPYNQSI